LEVSEVVLRTVPGYLTFRSASMFMLTPGGDTRGIDPVALGDSGTPARRNNDSPPPRFPEATTGSDYCTNLVGT
jgi:hypothetical protein